jgi:hypothetical protein
MRQPPENSRVFFAKSASSNCRPCRIALARAFAWSAPMCASRSYTPASRSPSAFSSASSRLFSFSSAISSLSDSITLSSAGVSSPRTSCSTYRISSRFGIALNAPSRREMYPSSVDLPVPFGPARP